MERADTYVDSMCLYGTTKARWRGVMTSLRYEPVSRIEGKKKHKRECVIRRLNGVQPDKVRPFMKGLGGSPLPREQAYVAFLFPHGDHADLSALANMAVLREEIIVSSHLKNFADKMWCACDTRSCRRAPFPRAP